MNFADQQGRISKERPKATFAVFGFNQEGLIAEAIRSAFDQEFPGLEIILSDDCSSDNTFPIMQQMAKNYQGPHRVLVRQSEVNRGTLNHVLDVASEMQSDFLIVAAGDDISRPNRASMLYRAWKNSNAWAVGSNFDVIDDNGDVVCANRNGHGGAQPRYWFSVIHAQPLVKGATAAYDRRVFKEVPNAPSPVLQEDIVFNVSLLLRQGYCAFVERPLVAYRLHAGSIAHRDDTGGTMSELMEFEEIRAQAAARYITLYEYLQQFIHSQRESSELLPEATDRALDRIDASLQVATLRHEWSGLGIVERARILWRMRGQKNHREFLLRLFGTRPFVIAKMAKKRFARGI